MQILRPLLPIWSFSFLISFLFFLPNTVFHRTPGKWKNPTLVFSENLKFLHSFVFIISQILHNVEANQPSRCFCKTMIFFRYLHAFIALRYSSFSRSLFYQLINKKYIVFNFNISAIIFSTITSQVKKYFK